MNRAVSIVFAVATIGLTGCPVREVATLHPRAAHVEIISGAPMGCRSLGDVYGTSIAEDDPQAAMQGARNDLRNQTASLGGTAVALQQSAADAERGTWGVAKKVTLAGVAYYCPPAQVGPPGSSR